MTKFEYLQQVQRGEIILTCQSCIFRKIEKTYTAEDIFEFNLIYCDAITSNVMNKLKTINK